MAIITEVIHFDSATSTGVQTINLTKFTGETPKAIIIIGSEQTSNATKVASILDHAADTEETIGNIDSFTSPNVTINFTTVSGNADNYIIWAIEASAGAGGNAPTGGLQGTLVGSLGGPI